VSKETWDVLQEREAWSYFTNDPDGIGPEVSLVCAPFSLSGNTEGLAGESPRDDLDSPAPRPTVESSDVSPNRRGRENPVLHSGFEDPDAVGVDFDVADGSPSEQVTRE
jgi:hypothetical protein